MKRWLPHLALVAAALAMVAVARARHVPTADALAAAFDASASADDRLWAMHVAACRASEVDGRLGAELALEFLSSGDERLAEAAVLIDLCRHAQHAPDAPFDSPPPLQEAYAYAPLPAEGWTPHRYRTLVLHRRKVGGVHYGGIRRMDLLEARWIIDTLSDVPLPPFETVQRHLLERGLLQAMIPVQRAPR